MVTLQISQRCAIFCIFFTITDDLFLLMYKNLYFKHIFDKLTPTVEQRVEAWQTTTALFDYLLDANAAADVELPLPTRWQWDIVDAFVSAAQDFAYLRAADALGEANVAAECTVDNAAQYLQKLIDKSSIVGTLQNNEKQGFAQSDTYFAFGYFAIIGLLRLRCSLGDYDGAAQTASPIDVTQKGLYNAVT